jgi:hypothetical protein
MTTRERLHRALDAALDGVSYTKLLSTSSSLEQAKNMVNKFWASTSYELIPSGANEWRPKSSVTGKEPAGFKVILEKGRYKFVKE